MNFRNIGSGTSMIAQSRSLENIDKTAKVILHNGRVKQFLAQKDNNEKLSKLSLNLADARLRFLVISSFFGPG